MTKRSKRTEFQVHKSLCEYVGFKYPKAQYFSDLAGATMQKKDRKLYQLRKMRGWPDFYLFELMDNRFNALMIELKREGTNILNKQRKPKDGHIKEQLEKIMQMRERGYCAGFAIGSVAACRIVDGYLSGDLEIINKYIYPTIKPIL